MTKPSAGEVFRYPFLWKREQMAGETEGRKTRPVCIAVTVAKSDSETVVFILPITTQPPSASRKLIEVPQIESQRVGLETHVRKWVMLDEINTDILERSYVWEDRTPIGTFSSVFTSRIQSSLIALARSGRGIGCRSAEVNSVTAGSAHAHLFPSIHFDISPLSRKHSSGTARLLIRASLSANATCFEVGSRSMSDAGFILGCASIQALSARRSCWTSQGRSVWLRRASDRA